MCVCGDKHETHLFFLITFLATFSILGRACLMVSQLDSVTFWTCLVFWSISFGSLRPHGVYVRPLISFLIPSLFSLPLGWPGLWLQWLWGRWAGWSIQHSLSIPPSPLPSFPLSACGWEEAKKTNSFLLTVLSEIIAVVWEGYPGCFSSLLWLYIYDSQLSSLPAGQESFSKQLLWVCRALCQICVFLQTSVLRWDCS